MFEAEFPHLGGRSSGCSAVVVELPAGCRHRAGGL